MSYALAIDCGTQSVRAMIIDSNGNMLAFEKEDFNQYFSLQPGWKEYDADRYWEAALDAIKRLTTKNNALCEYVIGICLTGQRDTFICIDEEGNPLRSAISWMDQRMAECKDPIPMLDSVAYTTVGMKEAIEIARRKSKANWIRENDPYIWECTYKYIILSTYLNFKMTGNLIDSVANQVGHIPFDYKNRNWAKSFYWFRWNMFGIEKEKLVDIVETGNILGYLKKDIADQMGLKEGIAVIAGGTDKSCETLGMGCLDASTANLSFGTTATVQTTTKQYMEPLRFMPSYPSAMQGHYNPEIQIWRGYWMLRWFNREFAEKEVIEAKKMGIAPEVLLNKRLAEIPPGCHGLVVQPYWGAGLKTPSAKGAIIGFGDVHTRIHIYRAIIEGINYGLMEGIEMIEAKTNTPVTRVTVSGGGAQSEAICQITADMMNKKVYATKSHESSGLGAAIVVFVALGIYKSYEEAVVHMVHYNKVYMPNKQNVNIYDDLFNKVYKKIYPGLSKVYREIQHITNYPTPY